MVTKVNKDTAMFIMVVAVINFVCVVVTTFGSILNLTGVIQVEWMSCALPLILITAADASIVLGAIVFVYGLDALSYFMSRLSR